MTYFFRRSCFGLGFENRLTGVYCFRFCVLIFVVCFGFRRVELDMGEGVDELK